MEEKKDDKQFNFNPVMEAIQAIRLKEGKKTRVAGTIPCPSCKADLAYSIASNGHIHGKCSGCGVGWMM